MLNMHLDIPFYSSFSVADHPLGVHCLEISIKMLLGYFYPKDEYTIKDLETITQKQYGKGSWSTAYSLWFIEHNFEVVHVSEFDFEKFKNNGIEHIRQVYGDEVADWQKLNTDYKTALNQIDEYIKFIKIEKRKPLVKDIVKCMQKGYVARVSVDSGYLNNTNNYEGHSVIVVGFDENNVWFHDPGLPAFKNRKITKEKFQIAMNKFGGEMDLIKPKG